MDREHLGNLLFLSSLATSAVACAGGTSGPAPRPGPFATHGGEQGGVSSDTWTDPLETAGGTDPTDSKGSGETGDWPSEGETGSLTNGTGGGPDIPPDDSGATGMASTSDASGGSSEGYGEGYGEGSTGYDPPVGGDPCPALAQLYADCNSDYTYANELELCQGARAQAQAISPACGAAYSEFLTCLSTLNCATLFEPGAPLPCVIQGAVTDLACLP